ncbi:FkbM family methyltransferase [Bacillota bacterium Meth-B3]
MHINDYKALLKAKLKEFEGKCIFLYGAKNMGRIAHKLLQHYHVGVMGYIVSGKTPKEGYMNGIPIYGLDDLPEVPAKNTVVVLTLNQMYHEQVISSLRSRGITCIDDSFVEFQYYFFADVFARLFEQNGIDLSGELLEIGNYRQLNPYIHSNMTSFFLEAGDLMLPAIFNNYDFLTEGTYEYDNVVLTEGDIVLDCGANIGLFSCCAASRGCTAYAFEPMVGNLTTILKQHARLYDPLIKPVPYALADRIGQMEINVAPSPDVSASLVSADHAESTEMVKVTTIDRFVEESGLNRVDFIKADIEGAERLMLAGAKETLKRFSPKLAICTYHLPDDLQVLEEIIREANPKYHVVHKWEKLFAWVK